MWITWLNVFYKTFQAYCVRLVCSLSSRCSPMVIKFQQKSWKHYLENTFFANIYEPRYRVCSSWLLILESKNWHGICKQFGRFCTCVSRQVSFNRFCKEWNTEINKRIWNKCRTQNKYWICWRDACIMPKCFDAANLTSLTPIQL